MPRATDVPQPASGRKHWRIGRIAVFAAALAAGWAGPARAEVSGRELLNWCQGALGAAVTATFNAFQCTAYLQAVLDQQQAAGTDLSRCLGRPQPGAGDLMARLVPMLEDRAANAPDSLREPANAIVTAWIAQHCGGAEAAAPPAPEPAPEPPPEPPEQAAIELAVWDATQRIAEPEPQIAALRHYLDRYPEGRFAELARLQIDALRRTAERETAPAAPPPAAPSLSRMVVGATLGETAPAAPPPAPPAPTPPSPPTALDRLQVEEAALSEAERRRIQEALQRLGLYRTAIDGVFGPGSRAAIRAFQDSIGADRTGYLTPAQRDRLERAAPPRPARQPETVRRFTLMNLSPNSVRSVYIAATSSSGWGGNRLRGPALAAWENAEFAVTDPVTDCRFDIRVTDEKGRSRDYRNVDLCRVPTLRFP